MEARDLDSKVGRQLTCDGTVRPSRSIRDVFAERPELGPKIDRRGTFAINNA